MTFESQIPDPLLRVMKIIDEHIIKQIGGTTEWVEYKGLDVVKIRWRKITKNGHTIYFEYVLTYDELAQVDDRTLDPASIAKRFVDNYNERVKEDG